MAETKTETETNAPLSCLVVTPEAVIFDRPVLNVSVPAFDGEIGILRNHAPLVSMLGLGEVRVRIRDSENDSGNENGNANTKIEKLGIDGGFIQVKDNQVKILAHRAVVGGDLEHAAVEAELKRLGESPPEEPAARAKWKREVAWAKLCQRIAPPPPPKF